MRYKIDEIENQIIDCLRAAIPTIRVSPHAGQIDISTFYDPAMLSEMLPLLPAIFVQYQGRKKSIADSTKRIIRHELIFRLYIATNNARSKREVQIEAYNYWASLFDTLHGNWIDSLGYSLASTLSRISGLAITGVTQNVTTHLVTLTVPNHGKLTGDKVSVKDVGGITEANNTANNLSWTVTVVDGDTLTLNGSVGSGSWTSGGTMITAITSTGFNPQSPFIENEGEDHRLVVNLPQIKVYQTDYSVSVIG